MKKLPLYVLKESLQKIQDQLSDSSSVNFNELNHELDALYEVIFRRGKLGTSEEQILWLGFKTISAQLELLRIRSFAYEQLNELVFPI